MSPTYPSCFVHRALQVMTGFIPMAAVVLLSAAPAEGEEQAKKSRVSNVVFILADDK